MKIAIVLCLFGCFIAAQATDYCSSSLCSAGRTHIACGNSGRFASSCPGDARKVNLSPYKDLILKNHNSLRNALASGSVSGFSPAKRMATIQWDDELASLASLNVLQCKMKHDACRNTDTFPYSGQNLAFFGYSGPENGYKDDWLIENLVNSWWDEYKDAKMEHINKYPSSYSGPAIGHFTAMARESNTRVGCGAARYKEGGFNKILLACNYATTNIVDHPIYVAGSTASGCTSGTDSTYNALCSTNEVYTGI